MNSLTTQLITSDAEFAALKPEWDSLHARARGTVFQTFQWLHSWWSIYRRPNLSLRIVAVRDGAELVGILPAFVEATNLLVTRFRRLRFLGTFDTYGEYTPLVLADRSAEVFPFLARFCEDELRAGSCDVITLIRYPSESPAMGIFLEELRKRPIRLTHDPDAIPRVIMPLPADWESYVKSLASAEQEILKRRGRSLQKNGAELEVVHEPSDADFDDYVRLHGAAWTGRGVAGYFSSAQFEAFHRKATAGRLFEGCARLYFLKKDGVRFAAVHAYFIHDQCCFYLSGLDRTHELVRYSPGKVLLSYVIRDAIAEGCAIFDFQGGVEDYKFRLGGKKTGFAKSVIWRKGASELKVLPVLSGFALYNFLVGGVWAYQIRPRVKKLRGLIGGEGGAEALPPKVEPTPPASNEPPPRRKKTKQHPIA